LDAYAGESHFLDHILPIWHAYPRPGTLFVHPSIASYAARRARTPVEALAVPPQYVSPSRSDQPILVASYGDVKKVRRMGRDRIAFIEHGIGQSYAGEIRGTAANHGSYAGGQDREDVSLFLVPNPTSARRWSDAYPAARVEVVGSPRLDDLPARQPGPGPVVAVSFHWNCHLVPETRGAFYAFKDSLPELARRWTLIGHGHPRAMPGLERYYKRFKIPVVPSFDDVSAQADLYVCDNSSTLYEFAATGRPVVVLNAPWYRRHVEHGLRFWEAAEVGINVDHREKLAAAVERALEDPPDLRRARERALDIALPLRSHGTERAVAALVSWAS